MTRLRKLKWSRNAFDGVVIDPDSVGGDPILFGKELTSAISLWTEELCKVVWLEIASTASGIISKAASYGFRFHHADERYAMMVLKLDQNAFVPPYATHYIGIGGVAINENREFLVVSERYRTTKNVPAYKLPGGALLPGEHLADAAVREVFEETGIETRFESLVCFRHWHGYRYGKSDIYFVARLAPVNYEIRKQEEEIDECLWMPVDEYLANDSIHSFNKTIVAAAMGSEGLFPEPVSGYEPESKFEFFMPNKGFRA